MIHLSRPVQRFAAVALLGLAIALLAAVTLHFATRIVELQTQIADERFVLGRFVAIAALEERVSEGRRLGRAADESDAYLKGESDPIRAAGLQTMLSRVAAANGVRLTSTRALPRRDTESLALIGTRVEFNADIEQLRAILHTIESARPFLFVDAMQVRPVSPLSQRDPEYAGLLGVLIDVYGALPRKKG